MPRQITNPIAQFHLEGEPDDPGGVLAVATFFGEDGERVEMRFTRVGASGSLAAMLFECAMDLRLGQAEGIMAVVARKGQKPTQDDPLTVDQILQAANIDPSIPPAPLGQLDVDRWLIEHPRNAGSGDAAAGEGPSDAVWGDPSDSSD